jgi:diguanylate cyclase (GGDEF)-like protein
VISIKKFLSKDDEAERALSQAVQMLIDGIGKHAAVGDPDVAARFRESIQEISDELASANDPEQVLTKVGSVVKTLEDHSRRTDRNHKLQINELQGMMKMLTSTVAVVSKTSETHATRLHAIENQITSASMLDDVRLIRTKLSACLDDIRAESERHQKENGQIVSDLTRALEQTQIRSSVIESTGQDSITGLPGRAEAEAALATSPPANLQIYTVVLVLDRLHTLNVRFGRQVGDEVLQAFANIVRKQLSPSDVLFRWSGPTLVAMLLRPGALSDVRCEVARVVDTKMEHTIVTSSRSLLLPISARWSVFPAMAAPRILYQRIDTFSNASGIATGARKGLVGPDGFEPSTNGL